MNLFIVGLNHNSAPIEIREKLSFSAETMGDSLGKLLSAYPVNEGVILSTCNRVEITAAGADIEQGVWGVKRFLSDSRNIPLESLDEHLYVKSGEDAVRHLYRVSAGLDSMVMGEPQILGQVKDAYAHALEHNAAGVIMNKLFHKTFSVAKRIRTETRIGAGAASISFAAVELAKKIFGDLTGKSVMLIGAGEMAELAARHFQGAGVREVVITNRTYERAVEMARGFEGRAIMIREMPHVLSEVDIVVTATAAPKFIIRAEQMKDVMKERRYAPMFFIDISNPRNVDPLINNIDGAYVYDIDDLQEVVESNRRERAKEAEEAEGIVTEEVGSFYTWVKSLNVVPTIVDLTRSCDDIRKGELEKAVSQMGELTKKQRKILDSMTNSIVKKIIHNPVAHLKRESHGVESDFYIAATRKLFDLDDKDEALKQANSKDDES